jgi:hypothetical protein
MPGRGAALENLDDDHASAAAWARVREGGRLVAIIIIGLFEPEDRGAQDLKGCWTRAGLGSAAGQFGGKALYISRSPVCQIVGRRRSGSGTHMWRN